MSGDEQNWASLTRALRKIQVIAVACSPMFIYHICAEKKIMFGIVCFEFDATTNDSRSTGNTHSPPVCIPSLPNMTEHASYAHCEYRIHSIQSNWISAIFSSQCRIQCVRSYSSQYKGNGTNNRKWDRLRNVRLTCSLRSFIRFFLNIHFSFWQTPNLPKRRNIKYSFICHLAQ